MLVKVLADKPHMSERLVHGQSHQRLPESPPLTFDCCELVRYLYVNDMLVIALATLVVLGNHANTISMCDAHTDDLLTA